jgi:hypothetical protein
VKNILDLYFGSGSNYMDSEINETWIFLYNNTPTQKTNPISNISVANKFGDKALYVFIFSCSGFLYIEFYLPIMILM